MPQLETALALRYLRPVRREGFISVNTLFSVVGIMLGVATLILVTSLMNGIRAEMTRLFIGVDGPVNVYIPPVPEEDARTIAKAIEDKHPLRYALPTLRGQLMATSNGLARGAQILAFQDNALSRKPVLADKVPPLTDGLLLGEALANALDVQPGDQVKLIAPQGRHSIAGFVPRIKTFTVEGTFKLGMHLYDSSLIIMPYEQALSFFKPPRASQPVVGQIEIGLDDPQQAEAVTARLQQELGDAATVENWLTRNQGLFRALDVQRNVMIVILALIICVAAFNIISSLIMLVQDKQSDIAILRTMGASKSQIMRAFCLSGTLIGVAGTALGAALGIFLAANLEAIKNAIEQASGQQILVEQIYFLSSLPTRTDPTDVLLICAVAILLAFLATLYPARRAAQIHPAEALRYG